MTAARVHIMSRITGARASETPSPSVASDALPRPKNVPAPVI